MSHVISQAHYYVIVWDSQWGYQYLTDIDRDDEPIYAMNASEAWRFWTPEEAAQHLTPGDLLVEVNSTETIVEWPPTEETK